MGDRRRKTESRTVATVLSILTTPGKKACGQCLLKRDDKLSSPAAHGNHQHTGYGQGKNTVIQNVELGDTTGTGLKELPDKPPSQARKHMLRIYKASLVVVAILFFIHAAFSTLYEVGSTRISTPITYIAFGAVFLTPLFRIRKTEQFILITSLIYIVLHLVFRPTPEFYGQYTGHATVLGLLEVVACATVVFSMRYASIRSWLVTVKTKLRR